MASALTAEEVQRIVDHALAVALAQHRAAVAEDLRAGMAPFAKAQTGVATNLARFDGALRERDLRLLAAIESHTPVVAEPADDTPPPNPVSGEVRAAKDALAVAALQEAKAAVSWPRQAMKWVSENRAATLSILANLAMVLPPAAKVVLHALLPLFGTGGAP